MKTHYRNPFRFYFLSALMPWTLWLIAACLSHRPDAGQNRFIVSVLGLAGLSCPLLVACYNIAKDRGLCADVAGRCIAVRDGGKPYLLVSILLMPASILLAMAISLLFGYDAGQFVITGRATFSSDIFPVWFILISAPVLEEAAWHSYGTDCLRQKCTLFAASMIFAVYWGLWHIPLALIKGYYHSNLVIDGMLHSINFIISLFPFVILMNWLYYRSGRNILVTIIFHLTANVFNEIFATHPDSKVIQTVLLLMVSAYLLVTERDLFFRKDYPRQSSGTSFWQEQIWLSQGECQKA